MSCRWFLLVEEETLEGKEISLLEEEAELRRGAEVAEHKRVSQLGEALGSMQIIMLGSRLVDCLSRCSMNVIWKELKMLPFVVSQRQ